MAGLVEQIQAAALNRQESVSDLLRKMKLAAVKLGISEAIEWVDHELKGYGVGSNVPEYRLVHGAAYGHSPYHGRVPVMGDPAIVRKISSPTLFESIASLESLVGSAEGGEELTIQLSPELTQRLNRGSGAPAIPIFIHLPSSSVVGIVDQVRNRVLDWAIELEKQGITGEGISFSMSEKQKAAEVGTQITIGTVFGQVSNAVASGENNSQVLTQAASAVDASTVFGDLTKAIGATVENAADRDAMLDLVEQMSKTRGTPDYNPPLQKMMEYAANYVTVLGPFLPALTKMLTG
jgi:hypothetical protein